MKKGKKQYESPCVETMECKVEKGFEVSGTEPTGQIENPIDGGSVNNAWTFTTNIALQSDITITDPA